MDYQQHYYISDTNMVLPLTTISLNNIYNIAINILEIIIITSLFIFIEAVKEIFKIDWNSKFTTENIVFIIAIYSFITLIILDDQRNKINEQKNKIESLEKYINYLKKVDRTRDEDQINIIQKINKKMVLIDKKIKKMEKDIKIFE